MSQLRKVAAGLTLVLVSLFVSILSVHVFVVSAILVGMTERGFGPPPETRPFVLLLTGTISGFGLLFDLVGKFLCLWTPRQATAALYLYVSLSLQVIGFCCLGNIFAAELYPGSWPPAGVGCLFVPSWVMASVLFLIFLRRLADFIGRRDLARTGTSVLFWSILSGVLATAHFVAFAVVDVHIVRLILIAPALATFVVSVTTTVRYVSLLIRLRLALLATARGTDERSDVSDAGRGTLEGP